MGNIMALVAYIFGWVSGLIIFLISKEDKVARFHGMQAILFNIVYSILFFVLAMIVMGVALVITMVAATALGGAASFVMLGASAIIGILGLAVILLLLWTMWQAFNNKMYKLPLIGGFAEKWSS